MGNNRPLTKADRLEIFRIATSGLVRWHGDKFGIGMTDAELAAALENALGIFGGSGAPGKPSVSFAGAGLRIWGSWGGVNHIRQKPLFAGNKTITMAREIYGIGDPNEKQMKLF